MHLFTCTQEHGLIDDKGVRDVATKLDTLDKYLGNTGGQFVPMLVSLYIRWTWWTQVYISSEPR